MLVETIHEDVGWFHVSVIRVEVRFAAFDKGSWWGLRFSFGVA